MIDTLYVHGLLLYHRRLFIYIQISSDILSRNYPVGKPFNKQFNMQVTNLSSGLYGMPKEGFKHLVSNSPHGYPKPFAPKKHKSSQ